MLRRLLLMEDPEAYLRALAARLGSAREGGSLPVVRFSLEAVANAFVMLGLLPAARAGEILAAQRRVLEAAGFRVGLEIGELSVGPGARGFQEARAAGADSLQRIPLAVAAGPVRYPLRGDDLVITSATLTPEGIWLRYCGDPRESDRHGASALIEEIHEKITELSITDDTGGTYQVPAGNLPGTVSGQCSASGGTLWIPEGEFLAVPAPREAGSPGGRPAVRWLEFSAGSGQHVRAEILPSAAVPTGTTEPAWPTPAECYLAELASIGEEWSIGSFETGTVELDTAAIVAAVADALLAVGAMPADSALLTRLPYHEPTDWKAALAPQWGRHDHAYGTRPVTGPGQESVVGLAVRLPLSQVTAVIENITAHGDLVSVQLYGHPWVTEESWPMITPGFRVTAVDNTGAEYWAVLATGSEYPTHEASGSYWFSSPAPSPAKQLRVIVSTLWEAAWALIDIPAR